MTDAEKREAARQFYYKWNNRGREDEDDRSYWIDFLQDVMGIDHVTDRIDFQKKVVGPDGNTKKIDAYISETKVLIEQKSLGIALDKPQTGHGGMTPYEQAKMYDNSLPHSEKAKWIVLSNFAEIWVYDMDARVPTPEKFLLDDIPTKFSKFEFLVNAEQKVISKEMEVSVKAGELVGRIYDAFYKQYINPENEDSLKSLNMLCVRLVFCLYAEDAHIFGSNGHMFKDYLGKFETKDMRKALIELFKILDTKPEDRDPYDTSDLAKFPYVNGGLFADENIEIPHFTDEIREVLLSNASDGFDWSMISPTIFGAVFESTLNPETRRSGGMHYTSIENIHKVIDPLFLDELKSELAEIKAIQIERTKKNKLAQFQKKLSSLKWMDPACGSGNFLTETYISVRRLENEIIKELQHGQMVFGETINPIQVSISQFYGIEINDFAVTVAKTALWIAESQMMKETEDIVHMNLEFLPLKTNAYIVEGNALRIDWDDVIQKQELNYIMGNPPFVGTNYMSDSQRVDMDNIFSAISKRSKLDYVTAWYKKCTDYIVNTTIRCAFVSTNSITQGEQVEILWSDLLKYISIIFAYKSFVWNSEAYDTAKVHCVIIGFVPNNVRGIKKRIYESNSYIEVNNINPYLVDAPDVLIASRTTPLCDVPHMTKGSQPTDGGYLLLSKEEKDELEEKCPSISDIIKKCIGSVEFINNKDRYCLWLKDVSPSRYRNIPEIMERIAHVQEERKKSTSKQTRDKASIPYLFTDIRQPQGNYLIVPSVSSQRRRYVPIGFADNNTIATNLVLIIPDCEKYEFGVITSNVHMAWMRVVCGRLKSDYRYSGSIVYNNFPWPNPTGEQKATIEKTAQAILDARNLYPQSSLADLYDPLTMPVELSKAHIANDIAVMKAYGFDIKNTTEEDCVAKLMMMYKEIVG